MRFKKTRNIILAKKNAIILLTLMGSILLIALKIINIFAWILKFFAVIIIRTLIKMPILPFYAKAKTLLLKFEKLKNYAKEELGENLQRNTLIYGFLVFISFFVAANNIKARELRPEEVGKNSGLYKLLADQGDLEILIQEEGYTQQTQKTETQLENTSLSSLGVESKTGPTGEATAEDDDILVASGGDAILKPSIPSTDITPQDRDSIITYVVQDGDTISQIADKFDVSTNTILWENKIGPRDFIKPGQELVILPVTGATHTIKSGDTLNSIASRYKAKQEDILMVNKLTDASELKIGAKIIIPDGIPPASFISTPKPSSGFADIGSIFKPAPAMAGKLNWPTTAKKVTQYYRGWLHSGIDIGAKTGQPIYAAEDGVVITSGWNAGGYGYYIIIDHGNGFHTLYAHASKLYVKSGEKVQKGDVIATIGSTGRSTGPHIHFEVRVNGNRVNPLDYL